MENLTKFIGLSLLLLSGILHSCKREEVIPPIDSNPSISYGSMTDQDFNIYKTVVIGTQTWMAENLKTTKYNDENIIPLVIDNTSWGYLTTPAYCWYNNNETRYKITYGSLYNWYTINTGKLCPTGWHVPSDFDWTALENYLITNGYNYDGANTGNKIAKSLASTSGWTSSTEIGAIGNIDYPAKRDASGFAALPGGFRDNHGMCYLIGYTGYWWSSAESNSEHAWGRLMASSSSDIVRYDIIKKYGYSVRCIKD